jgi:hypothetical protein
MFPGWPQAAAAAQRTGELPQKTAAPLLRVGPKKGNPGAHPPFQVFMAKHKPRWEAECRAARIPSDARNISKRAGAAWRALPAAQQEPYKSEARVLGQQRAAAAAAASAAATPDASLAEASLAAEEASMDTAAAAVTSAAPVRCMPRTAEGLLVGTVCA